MNNKKTTLSFAETNQLWMEGVNRVKAQNYKPISYGYRDVDAYIIGNIQGYEVMTDALPKLKLDVQAEIYRRAGELNEIKDRQLLKKENNPIADYGKHVFDQYIELNESKTCYQQKSNANNLRFEVKIGIAERIDNLNQFKINNDDLLKIIQDDKDEQKKHKKNKKNKKKKKKQNKTKQQLDQSVKEPIEQIKTENSTKELTDQDIENFKKEIIPHQQEIYDKYGYGFGYAKIKPVISEEFIKSLKEKGDGKSKLAK